MIFHSFDFIIFFLFVLILYWTVNRRYQNIMLLLFSYFFYGYIHPWFLFLIATSTVTDYFCGLGMERYAKKKKRFLYISLAVNLGLLATFKYFGFFVANIKALLNGFGLSVMNSVTLDIMLPVGISFYTFQTLSYTIDIYRGSIKPRRNFVNYALFVAFFPQLVAGPIERAFRLLPQIERKRVFNLDNFMEGFHLAVWGFFKKLVIADNVGLICNKIFSLKAPSFSLLWAGVFAFGVQIFADFSAYTDIARGVAKMLGIQLTRNFDHPYLSKSPAEFWRRWHISFSNWLRDYLFLPIAYAVSRRIKSNILWGMKAETWAYSIGILSTMFLCGLWHGASWNFIIWGMYYGLLILVYRGVEKIIPKFLKKIRWTIPFQVLLMFLLIQVGWLIFREHNLTQLIHDLTLNPFAGRRFDNKIAAYFFFLTLLYSLPLWFHSTYAWLREKVTLIGGDKYHRRFRYAAALSCYVLIIFFHTPKPVDFIYFQF